MLYEVVHHFPDDMIFNEEGPVISFYQPTHRHFPDNKQDLIMFSNLMRETENSLKQQYDNNLIHLIMKPFYQLAENKSFWNNTLDGIAVLASQNKCIIYNLHNTVKELAVVADSFHIKPLIKAFQSMERYHLLGLNRNNFTLYKGNKHGFTEIKPDPDIPRTMEEVLGTQLTDSNVNNGSYGGTNASTVFRGHSDPKEETDKDTEKYFRFVDRFVLENYSKTSKLPLILVALKEYHSRFKKISHNPYLIEEGIYNSYDSLDINQLKTRALEIIKSLNSKKTQKLVESYENANAQSLGSSDLINVARAAFEGRIETIFIEEDRIIPGKINTESGDIIPCNIDNPHCDDILDDIIEMVLKNSGKAVILPKENMPCLSGIAAIYRYN